MFTSKRMLVLWTAAAFVGLPARAADNYYSQPPHRKVAIWRGEGAPEPPMPPRLAQNSKLDIPPLPDEEADMPPAAEPIANGGCTDGSCGTGGCDGSCGGTCPNCCACTPFWAHRSSFFGDLLYFRATGDNIAYAILQNGVGGPGTTPNGRVGVVDSNYQTAYRVGFFSKLDQCSSIGVSYASYFSHATDQLVADQGIGDTIASLVLHPNSTNAGSTSSLVDASHDIDFRTVDLDYRAVLSGGCNHAWNYTVGLRYGKLQQDFEQLGNFTPPVGTIDTTTSIKFEGLGLRAGLDFERQVRASRISAYGKGFINVLFGQFNTQYTQLDTTSTIVQATSNWRDERVVPVLDYEIGLSWTSCSGAWRTSIGYYTAFWFNAVTTPQYIQAVQNANFVNLGDTVVFDGLVSRLEYRF